VTSESPLSTVEWEESGHTSRYAVDLPDTEARVPLAYFDGKQNVYGQYAAVEQISAGVYEAVRDPLGIGKMFYVLADDNRLRFSCGFTSLLRYGKPIYALPRGRHVRLSDSGERRLLGTLFPETAPVAETPDDDIRSPDGFVNSRLRRWFKKAVSMRLDTAFEVVRRLEQEGFTIFVALSGGLDSAGIAYAARRHLKHPVACTLDLGTSEDAERSALISRTIGIEQVIFTTDESEILKAVEASPKLCQDFRDFNVHCTALNLLLAQKIRGLAEARRLQPNKIVVLTGDTMNEFTCDYAAEEVDGTVYYRLPRVGKKMLQQILTGGLDTSDREILPFRHHGLACIQPYAIAYDVYLALPETVLQIDNVKQVLNGHLVPEPVLHLLPKTKLRAQVGSRESMGVLGICHKNSIDERFFLEKLLGTSDAEKQAVPITMGRYETQIFK
jgi:asparagine synthetase B (glutamine-hydrolysing)